QLANIAAGLEIQQLGIAPVTWAQVAERCVGADAPAKTATVRSRSQNIPSVSASEADYHKRRTTPQRRFSRAASKIVTRSQLATLVAEHRRAGKSIIFTNGCFDLLHVGHVNYLQEAAELGDILIVAINSDSGVKRLKGPHRPVIAELDRAATLASLACVDYVLIFDEETPHDLLACLRPDVLVKGGTTQDIVGREVVEAYGGTVCATHTVAEASTTQIISEIVERTGPCLHRN
ncbi:MAG TPA: adenylyltransferase/cytidyltransferase family protein, partial [Nitrospiraceae bacterium]|nr:adenylyltransferase/cytidyltransferase family protein [Nitrospiraceae bacterium]